MKQVYYGGAIERAGHYIWTPGRRERRFGNEIPGLPELIAKNWDGKFCPGGVEVEGKALRHYVHGWTVISFWDRSVDRRPGSNSTFLAKGNIPYEVLMEGAREVWPDVFARFDFEVVPVHS